MSYDLILMEAPPGSQRPEDWPPDFSPRPLGPRADLVARIVEFLPGASFDDSEWGAFDGGQWGVEFNLGRDDATDSVGLHVRGDVDAAREPLIALAEHLGVRAMDMQTDSYFDADESAEGAQAFTAYRDRVVAAPEPPAPTRKRWWRRG